MKLVTTTPVTRTVVEYEETELTESGLRDMIRHRLEVNGSFAIRSAEVTEHLVEAVFLAKYNSGVRGARRDSTESRIQTIKGILNDIQAMIRE